jgi:hypothetical protein
MMACLEVDDDDDDGAIHDKGSSILDHEGEPHNVSLTRSMYTTVLFVGSHCHQDSYKPGYYIKES